jgi:hypothetical protein
VDPKQAKDRGQGTSYFLPKKSLVQQGPGDW